MIDWWNLAANSLWILACALALAVFSYASWQASIEQIGLRTALARSAPQRWFSVAGLVFCLGLAGSGRSDLERIAWLVLAGLFLFQLIMFWRSR